MATPLQIGAYTVDLQRRTAHAGQSVVSLSAKETALLLFLAQHAGAAVTRQTLLTEVWGYHPSVVSRAVDVTVRRLRAKLETEPAEPRFLLTVHGEGYQLVVDTPPVAKAQPSTLPTPPTSWVGRSQSLDALRALNEHPWVTITGPGGVGKTALLLQHFANTTNYAPVFFCTLHGAETAEDIVREIADVLVIPLEPDADSSEQLRLALAELEPTTTLVLDNADACVQALGSLVPTWQSGLRVRVSSRSCCDHPDEHLIALGPLPSSEAMRLFSTLAVHANPGAPVLAQDDALKTLVEALDGLPLALELAASRSRILSVPQLVQQLESRFDILDSRRHDRSLRATFDASWHLLDEGGRAALMALSVFQGPFDLHMAQSMLGERAVDLLQDLVNRSLVQSTPERAAAPFQLLETLRAYASELRCAHTQATPLAQIHCDLFVARTQSSAGDGYRADLLRQLPDLLAAHRHAVVHSPHQALVLLEAISPLARHVLPFETHRTMADRTLEGQESPESRARVHLLRGTLLRWAAKREQALADLAIAIADGEPITAHMARIISAHCHQSMGDIERAKQLATHVTEHSTDARTLSLAWCALGVSAHAEGQLPRCSACFERGLEASLGCDDAMLEGDLHANLANAWTSMGKLSRALLALDHALHRYQSIGLKRKTLLVQMLLGNLHLYNRQYAEAEATLDEAAERFSALGMASRAATTRSNLAWLHAELGNFPDAERLIRDVIRSAIAIDDKVVEGQAWHTLGIIFHLQSDATNAAHNIERGLALLHEGRDRWSSAYLLCHLAAAQADAGQPEAAHAALKRAIEHQEQLRDPHMTLQLEITRNHLDYVLLGERRAAIELPDPATPTLRVSLRILEQALARANR